MHGGYVSTEALIWVDGPANLQRLRHAIDAHEVHLRMIITCACDLGDFGVCALLDPFRQKEGKPPDRILRHFESCS